MPRLWLALALAAALAAPLSGAAGGLFEGRGKAASLTIYGEGAARSTGHQQWTLLCTDCLVRVYVADLDGVTFQGGDLHPNGPGDYELRQYAGTIVETVNGPSDVTIAFAGWGEVIRLG